MGECDAGSVPIGESRGPVGGLNIFFGDMLRAAASVFSVSNGSNNWRWSLTCNSSQARLTEDVGSVSLIKEYVAQCLFSRGLVTVITSSSVNVVGIDLTVGVRSWLGGGLDETPRALRWGRPYRGIDVKSVSYSTIAILES